MVGLRHCKQGDPNWRGDLDPIQCEESSLHEMLPERWFKTRESVDCQQRIQFIQITQAKRCHTASIGLPRDGESLIA